MKKNKLHIGCGEKYIPEWINIDATSKVADMNINIHDLKKHFKENSIDEIYTCHTLEHFGRHEYMSVLKTSHYLLKNKGVITISVPDFHELISHYYETGRLFDVIGSLYGGQKDDYDYHKWGHTFETLSSDLAEIGFNCIERYDWEKTSHANFSTSF